VPLPSDVLSRRALNRALLDRQLLLQRRPVSGTGPPEERAARVIEVIEHLVGLQAQAPFPPYYGLWSRLEGFRPDDLAGLLLSRQVVRIALMRGTIHLVSAGDCLLLRPLFQPVLDRGLASGFGRQLPGLDLDELAAAGRALVEAGPQTFSELGMLLAERWPGYPAAALAQAIRTLVPLIQVPPRAVWGRAGPAAHTSAQSWLGADLHASPAPDQMVIRYLAAFGPATVRDIQVWSGLTRLREVAERLRPQLRVFRGEDGAELLDVPAAPRPDPGTPAPARLVAEYDNLVLSHGDRSRVISEAARGRLFTRNGVVPGMVLVDGFVAGMWKRTASRTAASLTIEMFGPVSGPDRDAIEAEAGRLLAFAGADGARHEIRSASLG
jgi:Winged helix DNA-binding domain